LVCILREDNFDRQGENNFNIMLLRETIFSCMIMTHHYFCLSNLHSKFTGVIDYNFLCFRKAIQQVFELRNKALAATNVTNHSSSLVSTNETSNVPTVSQTGTIGQNGTVVIAQS